MRILRSILGMAIAGIVVVAVCHSSGQGDTMTSAERKHAITMLRHAYTAFNRDDIDTAVAGLDPNIDWREPVEFPGGGAYHGRTAVAD